MNSNLSNEEIEKKIDESSSNPTKMWELINFYISKSKKNKDKEALFYAYRYASNTSKYPLNIKYADSALITGQKSEIKKILLDAYLNRGNINMSEEFYQKALDDILVAINSPKNPEMITFSIKQFITSLKIKFIWVNMKMQKGSLKLV
ncbi:hypothetical protein [Kaistella carnis]|uniref:hypothetical protein n=1 Tax=Kaistella carnis TaxID=1241979 RepID=UPI0028A2044D|nr:hypothetical protein [Kaistella carnis]